jgi:hypothetical protein
MATPSEIRPPITKTHFKLGLSCLLKLKHARPAAGRERPFPQVASENDMLRLLAEGGGAVEALWRQKEPGWVGPVGQETAAKASVDAIRSAVELSKQRGKPVPLYEVTIIHAGFLARIDLLRVSEARFEVVEMKAKSVVSGDAADEQNKILGAVGRGASATRTILADWVPYLQDLAFQTVLLRQWLASHGHEVGVGLSIQVKPGMILVNKSGRSRPEDSLDNFRTSYSLGNRGPRARVSYEGPGCADTELLVEMAGIPDIIDRIEGEALAKDDAFKGLGVPACMELMANVVRSNTWPDPRQRLDASCKQCEFRVHGQGPSGFDECWGAPRVPLHILTLPLVKKEQVEIALAKSLSKAACAKDVPEADVTASQRAVWECLQSVPPAPVVAPAFKNLQHREAMLRKSQSETPCYFLDFECALYPIPQQAGAHPYGFVPFQFEAHRLPSFEADLGKRERLEGFLDLTSADPRHGFLRALQHQMGSAGVIYHWHHYERDVLSQLKSWLSCRGAGVPADAESLVEFIDSLIGEGSHAGAGRLCDLLKIANRTFYHPDMLGSYSIKKVLPVAWQQPSIREHFWPGHSTAGDADSYADPKDPYLSLPSLPASFLESVGGVEGLRDLELALDESAPGLPDTMKNGGMAMLFYHYVRMFGGADRPEIRAQFRNYCGLDSAAMLMVFRYMTDVVPTFDSSTTAFPAS